MRARDDWAGVMAALVLASAVGGVAGVGAVLPCQPEGAVDRPASHVQREGDAFRPSVHGFRFVNAFSGSAMPPELRDAEDGVLAWAREMAERHIDMPERFGLCGGMSLLAADYYLAGVAVPDTESAPASGSALYDAIYARQRDSLGPGSGYIFKFSQWMALPDATPGGGGSASSEQGARSGGSGASVGGESGSSGERNGEQGSGAAASDGATAGDGGLIDAVPTSTSAGTRAELPSICQDLERGKLVPVGLVLTRAGRGRLWNNHQVLAYGLTRVDDATLHIHIYDPNYPGDDACVLRVEGIGVGLLGLDPASEAARVLRAGDPSTRGEMVRTTRLTTIGHATAVRGVFRMPYEARGVGE